ncbi:MULTISPECIES: 2Fe-2S iron-sulfur cluster-binding protein [Methylomonas]|uniref:Oxygenase n=2 Tax=Methylomonas TaxID=416 RepID=A0A140E4Y4_9GAMM|nr:MULTISPECIES: 2Fe-2S iron-sulfur cluster-binding protein [Methylomonas]AMK75458.1 oxygenase [Methylomonas denitrificans]OAI01907.1 oxygenase [Methylomonas methanica]TCV79987.1 NAD(P)H-flavin reductase [Methylomonas methanica]
MSLTIALNEHQVHCQEHETVLDALLREKIDIPYGCRQGACQSCMVRSLEGEPPVEAQNGLKDVLRDQNYFLACLCYPEHDMTISLASTEDRFTKAMVIDKQLLNAETLLLTVECQNSMDYYAGQFVNLKRDDGLIRSYSISNSRRHARRLSFHIRRLSGGRFSEWAHEELAVGDNIEVSDPQGLCYYLPNDLDQNLLLIGTGSGLAPLAGIIEEALHHGHRGDIHLFHGSQGVSGLYWIEEMQQLALEYKNFYYTPCVSRGEALIGISKGRANDVAISKLPNLKSWRIYLCGHPDMVNQTKRQAYLNGANLKDIYADAFHVASTTLD